MRRWHSRPPTSIPLPPLPTISRRRRRRPWLSNSACRRRNSSPHWARDTRLSEPGLAQQPRIQAYFESVHRTMIEQQRNFHRADAIPTTYLPNRTVHWLFVVIGAAAIALPAIIGRINVLVTAVSNNSHRLGD